MVTPSGEIRYPAIPFGTHSPHPITSTSLLHELFQGLSKRQGTGLGDLSNVADYSIGDDSKARPLQPHFLVIQISNLKRKPVIDMSRQLEYIFHTPFQMGTPGTVLQIIKENDWMLSLGLKDVFFQILIHPMPRRFLDSTKCYEP